MLINHHCVAAVGIDSNRIGILLYNHTGMGHIAAAGQSRYITALKAIGNTSIGFVCPYRAILHIKVYFPGISSIILLFCIIVDNYACKGRIICAQSQINFAQLRRIIRINGSIFHANIAKNTYFPAPDLSILKQVEFNAAILSHQCVLDSVIVFLYLNRTPAFHLNSGSKAIYQKSCALDFKIYISVNNNLTALADSCISACI